MSQLPRELWCRKYLDKMLMECVQLNSCSDNSPSVPLAEFTIPPDPTETEPFVPLVEVKKMNESPVVTPTTPTGNGTPPTQTTNGNSIVATKSVSDDNSIFSVFYTLGKKVAIVGSIYLVGYMGWSVAWLIAPVILSVARDQLAKTSEKKRDIAKASALASEKDVILARIDELPAWVYFPDVERCEWLNKVSGIWFQLPYE